MATKKKTPSRAERTEEKVKFAYDQILKGTRTGEIKRLFGNKFHCDNRSAERYLTSARAMMREEAGLSIDDHRAESYLRYRAIATDRKASDRDRSHAQERIDKLFGLEAEIKISTNGNTSVTVSSPLTPAEERAAVAAVLAGEESAHATPATGD